MEIKYTFCYILFCISKDGPRNYLEPHRVLQPQPTDLPKREEHQGTHGEDHVHPHTRKHGDPLEIIRTLPQRPRAAHLHLPHEEALHALKRDQQVLLRLRSDQVLPGHRHQRRRPPLVVLIHRIHHLKHPEGREAQLQEQIFLIKLDHLQRL